jgi:hypothetical protein
LNIVVLPKLRIFTRHGIENVRHTEPVVQLRDERHTGKLVWVAERLPAGGGLCVFSPALIHKHLLYEKMSLLCGGNTGISSGV